MSRPSKNTDQLLIRAARELLPETGVTGLNLRQVAKHAGVNLGMFHYHFKNKDEFTRKVLATIYEDFFSDFTLSVGPKSGKPLKRLEGALCALGRFATKNRCLFLSLIRDILNEDREVTKFLGATVQRHTQILVEIILECQAKKLIEPIPPALLLPQLMLAVNGPSLVTGFLERVGARKAFGLPVHELSGLIQNEKFLKRRVETAVQMIQVKRRKEK